MNAPRLREVRACIFDAYGTPFDVNSAAAQASDELGDKWQTRAAIVGAPRSSVATRMGTG